MFFMLEKSWDLDFCPNLSVLKLPMTLRIAFVLFGHSSWRCSLRSQDSNLINVSREHHSPTVVSIWLEMTEFLKIPTFITMGN